MTHTLEKSMNSTISGRNTNLRSQNCARIPSMATENIRFFTKIFQAGAIKLTRAEDILLFLRDTITTASSIGKLVLKNI